MLIFIYLIIILFLIYFYIKSRKPRVAFCLRGAIGKKEFSFNTSNNKIYNSGTYIDYTAVSRTIYDFIINANPKYDFDIFIHCWNSDLKRNLIKLYNPKDSLFEDNTLYFKDFENKKGDISQISTALSMQKVINMVLKQNIRYDYVILYRPDVILWKPINLDNYNPNIIYVNAHENSNGDFHFIMNLNNAKKFKELYNNNNILFSQHYVFREYIRNYMHEKLEMDNIFPLHDQEVLRKINDCSDNVKNMLKIKYNIKI